MPSLSNQLNEISLKRLRRRRSAKWTMHGGEGDVLPAWVAEMDFPLAAPVKRVLIEAIELDDCGYGAPAEAGLADAFAEFAGERLGWEEVDPAKIAPSANVVGALIAVLRELTEPGDRVVINPPVYPPFFSVIEEVGCEVAEVPLADNALAPLDVEGIERELAAGARAVILCSPHNPTGTVPSREQLVELAAAAARHDAWVLADEIHAPLTMSLSEHVPFLTVSEEARERGIAFSAASKAFNIAGLQCSVIAAASDGAWEKVEALPSSAKHPGHLGVLASVAAFREGGRWLDAVLEVIGYNRGFLGALLNEHLPEVVYRPPRAGYLTWLDFRETDLGEDPAAVILERSGLAMNSGPTFGPQGAGFARLNIGTSATLVEEAVERMAKAVRR